MAEDKKTAESMELGGNIILTGFKDVPKSDMIVLKKIVGNYVRKFRDKMKDYEGLRITLKPLHGGKSYQLNGELVGAKERYNAETENRNLFVGVDELLKKLEKQKD